MRLRSWILAVSAGLVLTAALIWAQAAFLRVGNGGVVAQSIGRLLIHADGTSEIIGHFHVLAGLPQTLLFARDPGEASAYFTARSTLFTIEPFQNGGLTHFRVRPVEGDFVRVRFYYDSTPDQDLSRPDTYSDGELTSSWRWHSGHGTITNGVSTFTGGLDLESGGAITHQGNLLEVAGIANAVTIVLTGPALQIRPGEEMSVAWGGTAISSQTR